MKRCISYQQKLVYIIYLPRLFGLNDISNFKEPVEVLDKNISANYSTLAENIDYEINRFKNNN